MTPLLTPAGPVADKGVVGALNALANYWIRKAAFDNVHETAVPEFNLEYGAGEAFGEFLLGQELDPTVAFEVGLEIAGLLIADPFGSGDAIRDLLHQTVNDAAATGKPRRDVGVT